MLETSPHTIEEGTIIRQVDKICRSSEFNSKKLLCNFLSYIVSEYLAGREDKIKGYSIAIDVFGRNEDFDPGQDALVRIHAGRLRRMLDLYYLRSGSDDPVRIEIPLGGYVPHFSVREDPGSSILEPVQETDPQQAFIEPSVAILPFKNLTGDPGKDYFAQGFSEELSIELTKYEDLIVYDFIHGSSSPVTGIEYAEFLKQKRARFVMEGAVNLMDNRIRLLAKLSDVLNGKQIWAESYTEVLTAGNLIDIQEGIAREISGIVGSEYGMILQKLSADAGRLKPQDIDTYCAVLKFYYFQANQSGESARQAFTALEKVLRQGKDPGIASALLAAMYGNRYMLDYPGSEESYRKMTALVENAYLLDPNNLMVKVIRAFIFFACNEKERFFQIAEDCLKRKPTISIRLGSLAFNYMLYGEWDRGKEIMDQLMVSGVGYPLYFHGATILYHYRLREYGRALAECGKYDVPSLFWAPMLRIAVLGQLGREDEAGPSKDLLNRLKPDFSEKARILIGRYVKEEALVDHVLEGLHKAGIKSGESHRT